MKLKLHFVLLLSLKRMRGRFFRFAAKSLGIHGPKNKRNKQYRIIVVFLACHILNVRVKGTMVDMQAGKKLKKNLIKFKSLTNCSLMHLLTNKKQSINKRVIKLKHLFYLFEWFSNKICFILIYNSGHS